MKRMRPASLVFAFGALFLCAMAGCTTERRATVSGKVTYLDKPVPGGTVVFVPEDKTKQGDRAQIRPDGTYTTSNVPFGKMKVAVEPAPKGPASAIPKGAKFPKDQAPGKYNIPGGEQGAGQGGATDGTAYVDIPDRYRNPEQSGLTVDIDSSSKTYDIPLTKK